MHPSYLHATKRRVTKCLLVSLLVAVFVSSCAVTKQPDPPTLGVIYYRAEDSAELSLGGLYYLDLETKEPQRLTPPDILVNAYTRAIQWSNPAQRLAYGAGLDTQSEIYTTDVTGQKTVQLTHNRQDDSRPSWSPDGKLIAYLSRKEDGSEQRAYLMNSDGSESRRLFKDERILTGGYVRWSPNGRYLAAIGGPPEYYQPPYYEGQSNITDLYIVDVGNGSIKYQLADGTAHVDADWSLDGKQLAVVKANLQEKAKLYKWTPETGEQQLTTNIEDVIGVDWSPDGKWLAFLSGDIKNKVHLYVIQPDGQGLKEIAADLPYVLSDGLNMWSPDSRCLVFTAPANDALSQWNLYIGDVTTGLYEQITSGPGFDAAGSWIGSSMSNTSCVSYLARKP